MLRSSASLLGIAATVLSFNLPANESVPGLSLAQIRADVRPAVAYLEVAPAAGLQSMDSTDSTNNADDRPNAWLCALGFLGLVVLRRTRSDPMM